MIWSLNVVIKLSYFIVLSSCKMRNSRRLGQNGDSRCLLNLFLFLEVFLGCHGWLLFEGLVNLNSFSSKWPLSSVVLYRCLSILFIYFKVIPIKSLSELWNALLAFILIKKWIQRYVRYHGMVFKPDWTLKV